jgi:8-oxo-dGTP pyrophosphatase MutT (NUDIX family)
MYFKMEHEFGKCMVTNFSIHDKLYEEFNGIIEHHYNCPMERIAKQYSTEELNKLIESYKQSKKEIKFACVGLIADSKGLLLLTRRTPKLSSFPKAWVFPGGKVDENENHINTLLREVREETGIDILEKDIGVYTYGDRSVSIKPLMLYESVFPDTLEKGLPERQVLVMYFYIGIDKDCSEIKVTIDSNEVDTYLWIDVETLEHIFSDKGIFELIGYEYDGDADSVNETKIHSDRLRYWDERGEGITYGHYRAFKMLNSKLNNK